VAGCKKCSYIYIKNICNDFFIAFNIDTISLYNNQKEYKQIFMILQKKGRGGRKRKTGIGSLSNDKETEEAFGRISFFLCTYMLKITACI
jgi:hypothetical protein